MPDQFIVRLKAMTASRSCWETRSLIFISSITLMASSACMMAMPRESDPPGILLMSFGTSFASPPTSVRSCSHFPSPQSATPWKAPSGLARPCQRPDLTASLVLTWESSCLPCHIWFIASRFFAKRSRSLCWIPAGWAWKVLTYSSRACCLVAASRRSADWPPSLLRSAHFVIACWEAGAIGGVLGAGAGP